MLVDNKGLEFIGFFQIRLGKIESSKQHNDDTARNNSDFEFVRKNFETICSHKHYISSFFIYSINHVVTQIAARGIPIGSNFGSGHYLLALPSFP